MEVWQEVAAFTAYILGARVRITTSMLINSDATHKFMTRGSHSIKSDSQAGPYQSGHLQETAEESLRDWIDGIACYIRQPGAKMVPDRVDYSS